MNAPETEIVSIVLLSAGGALPAFALARGRLVTIPLAPLAGAVLAGLSVTAMTGIGGTLLEWYVGLSSTGRRSVRDHLVDHSGDATMGTKFEGAAGPSSRRHHLCVDRRRARVRPVGARRPHCLLRRTRAIWTLHPLWYEAGHATTVAALRNAALVFTHPQYPPLIGGSIALSWKISGLSSVRSGVVIIAVLSALAVLAAATGVMELARRTVPPDSTAENRLSQSVLLGVGAVLSVLLALTAIRAAGQAAIDGHADLLWAAAAVGAVTYGLVLPSTRTHVGTAMLLAAVAGTTKIEGTLTAASIIVLIGIRGVLAARPVNAGKVRRKYVQPIALALGSLMVVGAWPLVTHLLHALPNVEWLGKHEGTDWSRLGDTISSGEPHLEVLAVAVPLALVGAIFLRTQRRAAGVGNDAWAWAAILIGLTVAAVAYVTGPGAVEPWLLTSVQRITLFPLLAAWWIVASWVVVAAGQVPNVINSVKVTQTQALAPNWHVKTKALDAFRGVDQI